MQCMFVSWIVLCILYYNFDRWLLWLRVHSSNIPCSLDDLSFIYLFFFFFWGGRFVIFLNLYMKIVLNESPFSLLALGKNYYPH